jgi:hypothetical protein
MQVIQSLSSILPEPEIMEVSGYLDSNTAPQVEYITGAGMRSILVMARAMKAVDGRFAVCGLQPQVKAMLQACGYDRVIPLYERREEAIEKIAI